MRQVRELLDVDLARTPPERELALDGASTYAYEPATHTPPARAEHGSRRAAVDTERESALKLT
jgi:hypothetical protein